MLALSRGDQSVLDRLIDGLYPIVLRFTQTLLQEADAKDATQKTFEKLMSQHRRFDPKKGNALSWVLAIASWECRTLLRRSTRHAQKHSASIELYTLASVGFDEPIDAMVKRERMQHALDAIDTLNEKDKAALLRSFLERALTATERKQKERALVRLRRAMGFS